jgi:hypothetical protein
LRLIHFASQTLTTEHFTAIREQQQAFLIRADAARQSVGLPDFSHRLQSNTSFLTRIGDLNSRVFNRLL